MQSSVASPRPPPSSLPHSSISFPLPNGLFFLSDHNKTHQRKMVLFGTEQKKIDRVCSKDVSDLVINNGIRLIKQNSILPIKEEEKPNLDGKNCRLQIQDLVDRITALPTTPKIKIIDGFQFQTISDFNYLLMALVTADELEFALKLYSNLSSYELLPDCWTYSIMVQCYSKKNDPNEANRVLEHMLENGFQPNVATFTALINSFCKSGKLQKAFEIIRVMGRVGCEPTVNTYNCLLKGLCYVGRVEEAYELLKNIKKSSKKPDIYTYTAVMNGFCKVGRSNEALELLNEAMEMGLIPNVVTFNTLFNGYFKEGRPLEGIDLLKKMKERNCVPDYISYSTLLHGLLKWGETKAALQIYKEMVGVGFEVDERMMNTLLRGLCRRSRTEKELLKDAYELFNKMTNGVYVIYPCAYGLVIETFCIGKEVDKAVVSLGEMVRLGYSPRTTTFNYIIRALCIEGKVEAAASALVLMFEGSRMPSRVGFNILIDEFNRQGRSLGACNVYGAALKRGVVPQRKPREYVQPE